MKNKINIIVDGKKFSVPQNKNLLECVLDIGIYIPHLCHHPSLNDIGSCKLCAVEVKGFKDLQTSCTFTPFEGMEIITNNDKINKHRVLSMELILSGHPEECTGCPKYGNCELQKLTQYIDASNTRLNHRSRRIKPIETNPHIDHDMNKCILCGRCVRACSDLRGVGILEYTKKDRETIVIYKGENLQKSDCAFCMACIEVCPTGSIRDKISLIENSEKKEDFLVPCKHECPAHTDIPKYLRYAKDGDYEKSIGIIREKLPIPKILGYICNHECESKCKRNNLNSPLSIRNVKRFVSENTDGIFWKNKGKQLEYTNKNIAIIGGGPCGLTSGYYLRKQGHNVTIFEKQEKLGGMLRYGIPNYRLPDNILDEEINIILETGIKVKLNQPIESLENIKKEFDAILICIGAHEGVKLPLENNNINGVLENIKFLNLASQGMETGIGKKVIVLGGGNVAFDCGRTAIRLGANEVHIVCLESREKMTADIEEIEQGIEEGIILHSGRTFEKILGDTEVTGLELMKIEDFYFDEFKKPHTIKKENSNYKIDADTIIFSVGQKPNFPKQWHLEFNKQNKIDKSKLSDGIFIAGDCLYGTKSVIEALANGRKVASEIDIYLGGDGDINEKFIIPEKPNDYIGLVQNFGFLERKEEKFIDVTSRKNSFDLISNGLDFNCIKKETTRCMQCDLRLNIKSPRSWNDFQGGMIDEF